MGAWITVPRSKGRTTAGVFLGLLSPLIIVGGLSSGIDPTIVLIVAIFFLILGVFIYNTGTRRYWDPNATPEQE